MSTTFFGFALADSMFAGNAAATRIEVTANEAMDLIAEAMENGSLSSCLNPSHAATINAMRSRYDIDVPIPEKAPFAALKPGDKLIVMGVRGLPRLDDKRHEYTVEEIASATFTFSVWERTA